jgi:hypothetical protein
MKRLEIPTVFKFHEDLIPNVSDIEVYRLYSTRRNIEHWCQTHFNMANYHILIERRYNQGYPDVEARIFIDFKHEDDAMYFKLCYLEKE